jgi:cell pole-organizing protein PopZ
MEDILASIRQILSEDEQATPDAPPLELTEAMLVEQPVEPMPMPVVIDIPQPAATSSSMDLQALLAPATAAATAAALGELARAVAGERTAPVSRGGASIEDVVREEIRPLLKAWLDQHLPGMVEQLVKAEIARVIGRNAG